MNNIDKVKEVFDANLVIAEKLGNPGCVSTIIEGIKKEVLDVLQEQSE